MTTYADLLYEAAELLAAQSVVAVKQSRLRAADDMVQLAENIREALRTSPVHPALSTEDVERIKKHYDPTGSMYQDINVLADSHEQIRREKDTATSIAERLRDDWLITDDHQWYKPVSGTDGRVIKSQLMMQDQIDWFEARK